MDASTAAIRSLTLIVAAQTATSRALRRVLGNRAPMSTGSASRRHPRASGRLAAGSFTRRTCFPRPRSRLPKRDLPPRLSSRRALLFPSQTRPSSRWRRRTAGWAWVWWDSASQTSPPTSTRGLMAIANSAISSGRQEPSISISREAAPCGLEQDRRKHRSPDDKRTVKPTIRPQHPACGRMDECRLRPVTESDRYVPKAHRLRI